MRRASAPRASPAAWLVGLVGHVPRAEREHAGDRRVAADHVDRALAPDPGVGVAELAPASCPFSFTRLTTPPISSLCASTDRSGPSSRPSMRSTTLPAPSWNGLPCSCRRAAADRCRPPPRPRSASAAPRDRSAFARGRRGCARWTATSAPRSVHPEGSHPASAADTGSGCPFDRPSCARRSPRSWRRSRSPARPAEAAAAPPHRCRTAPPPRRPRRPPQPPARSRSPTCAPSPATATTTRRPMPMPARRPSSTRSTSCGCGSPRCPPRRSR